jgi:hypothetical protein
MACAGGICPSSCKVGLANGWAAFGYGSNTSNWNWHIKAISDWQYPTIIHHHISQQPSNRFDRWV